MHCIRIFADKEYSIWYPSGTTSGSLLIFINDEKHKTVILGVARLFDQFQHDTIDPNLYT